MKGRKGDLEKLGPEQVEDGGLRQFARVGLAVREQPVDRTNAEDEIVTRLVLLMPYVKAVLVELATVVFFGVAFGHRRATVANENEPSVPVARPATVVRLVTVGGGKVPGPTAATVARGATVAQNATVAHLRPVSTAAANPETVAWELLNRSESVLQDRITKVFGSKSRSSRWLSKLEREGQVRRSAEGRCKRVSLTRVSELA